MIAALWPTADAQPARQALAAILIAVWSLRLGTYMWRRAESGPDDPRYATMKREWGEAAPARLFRFLQRRRSVPGRWSRRSSSPPRAAPPDWRDAAAVALFCLALGLESVADADGRVPPRSAQQGTHLRHGPVGMVAPSQLFLRMAGLVDLAADRHPDGPCRGLGRPGRALALMYWLLAMSRACRRWKPNCGARALRPSPTTSVG